MDKAQWAKDYLGLLEDYGESTEDLDYFVRMVLASYEKQQHWEKDERTGEASFLKVGGKNFRCVCSGNVFSKMKSGRFKCYSCGRLYGGH